MLIMLSKGTTCRKARRGLPLVLGSFFFTDTSADSERKEPDKSVFDTRVSTEFDIINRDKQLEEYNQMYSDRSSLTASQRLSLMWRFDEYGEVSPELSSVIASVKLATLIGAGYGMYTESRRITKKFLDTHKHEMFKHPREAVASLQDQALLAYFKGGSRWGLKLFILSFSYVSVAQSMACIRNYINPLDHALAGAVMGAIFKFNMGPKGMLSGGVVGSLLGLNGGLMTWLLQYASGETVEERWQREYLHIRNTINAKGTESKQNDVRLKTIMTDSKHLLGDSEEEEKEETSWIRNTILAIQRWIDKEHQPTISTDNSVK